MAPPASLVQRLGRPTSTLNSNSGKRSQVFELCPEISTRDLEHTCRDRQILSVQHTVTLCFPPILPVYCVDSILLLILYFKEKSERT